MNKNDVFKSALFEYFVNTCNSYEKDVARIKNDIAYYGYDAGRLYDLIVCETRLDCVSSEFRKIKQIFDSYYDK